MLGSGVACLISITSFLMFAQTMMTLILKKIGSSTAIQSEIGSYSNSFFLNFNWDSGILCRALLFQCCNHANPFLVYLLRN